MTDITSNVRLRKEVLSNITLFDLYDIKDGETPDIIAHKVYGNSNLHWTIMIANEKFDLNNDWPVHYQVLEENIKTNHNRFEVESWSFSGRTVTAIIPNHGISLTGEETGTTLDEGELVSISVNPICLENVYVKTRLNYGGFYEEIVSLSRGFQGDMNMTVIDEDTVRFDSNDVISGTIPSTWPAGTYTWEASGGFTLFTSHREYRLKHWELNGFVVNPIDIENIGQSPVSYYDFEQAENESKRRIKLISPSLIGRLIDELARMI